jgi:hypothetical protein
MRMRSGRKLELIGSRPDERTGAKGNDNGWMLERMGAHWTRAGCEGEGTECLENDRM